MFHLLRYVFYQILDLTLSEVLGQVIYYWFLEHFFSSNWIFQGVMQAGQQDACFDGIEGTNTTDCNDG